MFSRKDHCDLVLDLWEPLKEKFYWVIVSIVNDRHLAEDIIQESLIIAIEKFQTLRETSKFEPWLLTIAIRKSYEIIAKKKQFTVINNIENETFFNMECFDKSIRALDYKDLVIYILTNLKPESKKYLFYLRYIEDRSIDDIVNITGIKEGTVKSMFFRMKKELSGLLGKEYMESANGV